MGLAFRGLHQQVYSSSALKCFHPRSPAVLIFTLSFIYLEDLSNLSFDLCICRVGCTPVLVFFPLASPLLCASLPWVFALTKHWTMHPLGPVYYTPSALLQVSWLKWVSGASMWPGPASGWKLLECRWSSSPHIEMGMSLTYGGQSCAACMYLPLMLFLILVKIKFTDKSTAAS